MAFLEQQQMLTFKFILIDFLSTGESMFGRQSNGKLIIEQGHRLDLIRFDGQRQNQKIEMAVDEIGDKILGLRFAKIEPKFRIVFVNLRQDFGKEVGADGRDDAKAKLPRQRVPMMRGGLGKVLHGQQNIMSSSGDIVPFLGQQQA